MQVTLLHNPSAGDEDHGRAELESLIADAGHSVRYQSLDGEGWAEVLEHSADVIVIAGGDGSIREVFTAIGRLSTPVLVLPLGSANNIAHTLGLDFARARSLLAEASPPLKRFDLWDVRSTWGASRSVEAVGGGLFAELLAEAEDAPSEPSGPDKVDFGLRLLALTLREAVPRRWSIEIDGERIEEELIGVEAMNIRAIGSNLCFAPDADPSDGMLDVVLVRADDRGDLAAYVSARLGEEEPDPPRLDAHRAHHVVLEPPAEVRLHVDDVLPAWDLTTTRWVEITPAGSPLEVLAPSTARL